MCESGGMRTGIIVKVKLGSPIKAKAGLLQGAHRVEVIDAGNLRQG